jgi:hypothetical protein
MLLVWVSSKFAPRIDVITGTAPDASAWSVTLASTTICYLMASRTADQSERPWSYSGTAWKQAFRSQNNAYIVALNRGSSIPRGGGLGALI